MSLTPEHVAAVMERVGVQSDAFRKVIDKTGGIGRFTRNEEKTEQRTKVWNELLKEGFHPKEIGLATGAARTAILAAAKRHFRTQRTLEWQL